ncbi:hypothetical protein Y032_0024g995 [Ancylostoma ceylanicum]|uniref:Uncharacterized protein n=1 Tax=Ancylostoma ceylanicum TaxID=53326 RepID=A0A016UYW0_9BILA|nr:hypothetical protein Y032_0024g995 [Ancylostoma ceylanicum]
MFLCFFALAFLATVMAQSYGVPPAQEPPYGAPPAQQQPLYPPQQMYPLKHVRVWLHPVPGHHHHHHHGHGCEFCSASRLALTFSLFSVYPGFPMGWPYPFYGWEPLSNPFYTGRRHHRHHRHHSHSHHDSRRGCDGRDDRDC